ncbi:MAG: hypothetical protein E4G90_07435 [Gemmatimonadales bacterium]|nr:MAG: hypothetical protein E4G90_07435 [Gemmatimonadales bacterium]
MLMIAAGVLPLNQAAEALGFLARPVLTIVSLMAITVVADQAGLFRLIAWQVAQAAGHDGRKLFAYLFIAGTITGTLFTNDAAVLIFTPLVFRLVEEVQEPSWGPAQKVPYYFAILYVANLVGAFVTSNPINIVVSRWFGIGFLEYAAWMVAPAIASMVVSYWGLRWFFRSAIPVTCGRPESRPSTPHPRFLVVTGAILGLTLIGFFTQEWTGIPIAYVAATGAVPVVILRRAMVRGPVTDVMRGIGWDVIVFVVGIFLVASGHREAGFTEVLGQVILAANSVSLSVGTLVTGLAAAVSSAVMNNHPVAGISAMAIGDLSLGEGSARILALAALVGGDLGPKMLPLGSLAALMWFRILRSNGVEIPYRQYIKIGIPVTLAAVIVSILVLNVEVLLAGGP